MPGLLTLNLSNPSRVKAQALLHWLWPRAEDVWVLTEIGGGEGSRLIEAVCRRAGYSVMSSDVGSGRSALGVVVVARDRELVADQLRPSAVLPERMLAVRTDGLRLLAVYGAASDPVRYSNAAQRARKREWLAQFAPVVSAWSGSREPGVLIGDLNVPDPRHDPALKYVMREELAFYRELTGAGLRDAFAEHHPDADEPSWLDHTGLGCRYDHAFVTEGFVVRRCDLDQTPRIEGHTDHAALVLDVDAPGSSQSGAPA